MPRLKRVENLKKKITPLGIIKMNAKVLQPIAPFHFSSVLPFYITNHQVPARAHACFALPIPELSAYQSCNSLLPQRDLATGSLSLV
jgi:hypothetical protein